MKFNIALSASILLPFAFAGSVRVAAVKYDDLGKRTTEQSPAAGKQGAGAVGYLPNAGEIGNGTEETPQMGHGPVVVDGFNSTGTGMNETETSDYNSTESASGVGGSMDYGTGAGSNSTGSAAGMDYGAGTGLDGNETSSMTSDMLIVSQREYTMAGNQRVELSIKYGMSHVNQTWEVSNGILNAVPELSTPAGCTDTSAQGSSGNSTDSLYGGEDLYGESTSGDSTTSDSFMPATTSGSGPVPTGNNGTSDYMVRRPDAVHPGFTGPK
ncbi:MAG: hypothetical protein Q9222_007610 [Ikaeria aurantiellina]